MLEEQGIGRPSTYTTIITTIIARNYVKREGKAFIPTPLGEVINKLMKEHFSSIVDYRFTAEMEDDLDEIENGTHTMHDVLEGFWVDFSKQLEAAEKLIGLIEHPRTTLMERCVVPGKLLEGDSVKDISSDFGISESKVKMRLLRTRKQLADYLNKEGITV
jgi:DNA topoisomerase-1